MQHKSRKDKIKKQGGKYDEPKGAEEKGRHVSIPEHYQGPG